MPETPLANITANLQRALPPARRTWIVKRAPWLVFVALLVPAAWLAARLTWQLMSGPSAAPPSFSAQSVRRAPERSALAEQIAAAHLFGTAPPPNLSPTGGANTPETNLNLQLIGVAAGKDGAKSQAIIASGNTHEEKTYGVGDAVPGGAVIHDVLPDRVILEHAGRLEELRLPLAGTSLIATSMHFGPSSAIDLGPGAGSRGQIPGGLAAARAGPHVSLQHPGTVATRYLHWRPVMQNGHQQGVAVAPGPDPELFRRAGLKPGDVITSVNGIKLDSRQNLLRGLSGLSGTAHLVVLRQGKKIPITVNLGWLSSGG